MLKASFPKPSERFGSHRRSAVAIIPAISAIGRRSFNLTTASRCNSAVSASSAGRAGPSP